MKCLDCLGYLTYVLRSPLASKETEEKLGCLPTHTGTYVPVCSSRHKAKCHICLSRVTLMTALIQHM
jgi:hypothetical protein